MAKKLPLDEATKEDIVRRYLEGSSMAAIRNDTGISHDRISETIHEQVDEAVIRERTAENKRAASQKGGRPERGERNAELTKRFRAGESVSALAREFGVSESRVRQVVHRAAAKAKREATMGPPCACGCGAPSIGDEFATRRCCEKFHGVDAIERVAA